MIATLCLSLVGATTHAENAVLSDTELNYIKSNCIPAKNTLNQLHASDALLRVNRGQVYESITTKLMQRFAHRVENNKLDASSINAVLANYTAALAAFRADYIVYEQSLTTAIHADCSTSPSDFYGAVSEAKSRRLVVHSDIERLNSLIDQYQHEFTNIKTTILQSGAVN